MLDHVDSNFSSIENLWPQVDTCFRPFRATLKISEVEPQCTLKILQSKTFEKAKPLLMVTVHTERSSCPCLCSGVVRLAHRKCEVMAQYLVQTAYEEFKVRYEESRAQCGHYNLLLSSTRITLEVVQSTTKNKFWKIEQLHKILFVKKINTAHAAQR